MDEKNRLPSNDLEFEEVKVRRFEPYKDGDGGILTREDGFVFRVPKTSVPIEPGMTARFYGRGMGYTVRGLAIDGQMVFYRSAAMQAEIAAVQRAEYDAKHARDMAEPMLPEGVPAGFEWTEGCAQISGFGGVYERACRQMVSQGAAWAAAHPDADPRFRGMEGVYGLLLDDNEDAKALSAATCAGVDPSGAMHQACIAHVMLARGGPWSEYQQRMRDLAVSRAAAGKEA